MAGETIRKSSLTVPAELGGSAADTFESRLAARLDRGPSEVAVDCAGLDPVTSGHIALLWNAQCACTSVGARLRLESPSPALRRVLQVLDLESMFTCDSAPIREELQCTEPLPVLEQPVAYKDEFAPTPESIDAGILRFLEFLSHLDTPEMVMFELRIVLYEITTNIMCHSKLTPLDRVGIEACADASAITLQIIDPGPAFDPTAYAASIDYKKAGRERRSRGFGLAMIRGLVDSMEYTRRNASSNVLTVSKQWSADA